MSVIAAVCALAGAGATMPAPVSISAATAAIVIPRPTIMRFSTFLFMTPTCARTLAGTRARLRRPTRRHR
ncbi:hypothetical protein, partial [Sphingomonas sp. CCH9-F2]|uniref:hypothetical protein n=1 Tax=Sphingomonas sp. CCH9-F2 TaxID=1768778 RepID=UPI001E5C746D